MSKRDKEAKRLYDLKRRSANRGKFTAQTQQWYQANKHAKKEYDHNRKPVKNSKRRAEYATNPDKFRESPEILRARRRLRKYGLTVEAFDAIFLAQDSRCACCRRQTLKGNKSWCVDHDHQTGAVRGILCGLCNTGIGALGDTLEGLTLALDYLKKHYASTDKQENQ